MSARRFIITGRVQGVWFRATAKEKAKELGITGWARNCEDGSVEIHAEGPEVALKEFEIWCSKGPPAATVEHLESNDSPVEHCSSFEVIG